MKRLLGLAGAAALATACVVVPDRTVIDETRPPAQQQPAYSNVPPPEQQPAYNNVPPPQQEQPAYGNPPPPSGYSEGYAAGAGYSDSYSDPAYEDDFSYDYYSDDVYDPEPIEVRYAPPPMRYEPPPPMPYSNAVWVGGYWHWDDNYGGWSWFSGHWVRAPRYDVVWEPPYYENRGGLVIYVAGHWRSRSMDFRPPPRNAYFRIHEASPNYRGVRPDGPSGTFVPPPPGSRAGVIVSAPVGTHPAVIIGAPPVVRPGMVVQYSGNMHAATPNSSVTLSAPAGVTRSGQPVRTSAPVQAYAAASQRPQINAPPPRMRSTPGPDTRAAGYRGATPPPGTHGYAPPPPPGSPPPSHGYAPPPSPDSHGYAPPPSPDSRGYAPPPSSGSPSAGRGYAAPGSETRSAPPPAAGSHGYAPPPSDSRGTTHGYAPPPAEPTGRATPPPPAPGAPPSGRGYAAPGSETRSAPPPGPAPSPAPTPGGSPTHAPAAPPPPSAAHPGGSTGRPTPLGPPPNNPHSPTPSARSAPGASSTPAPGAHEPTEDRPSPKDKNKKAGF